MGIFLLSMMNLSVMVSLRNLPIVAEFGLAAACMFILVMLIFFLPVSLVSAELATGWSKDGGIYAWVKEAFGPFWGFFSVWMQWVHNITWYPVILSFSGATLMQIFNPKIATNPLFLFLFVLVGFWGFTLFNYFGIKSSTWFSAFGVIVGTIIPGLLLILFAIIWIAGGDPVQIPLTWDAFIPSFELKNLVFLTGLYLAFGGIEVSAVYAGQVQHPKKNYPLAIFISGFLCFVLYALGSLAISIMIPPGEINLVKGLVEAFEAFLTHFHASWLFAPLALMIVISALGEINAWIIGPVESLHATSKHGDLPPFFQKLNKHNRPFNLLIFQAVIVSVASFAFFLLPDASTAFWVLSVMAAQIYLVMYIFLFLAGLKLRYSHPNVERKYKVPFKNIGMWILTVVGVLASLLGIGLGFVPPDKLFTGSLWIYEGFIVIGLVIMTIIPYLVYKFRHPRWHPEGGEK